MKYIAVLLVVIGCLFSPPILTEALCQVFPYQAPQAPEFNSSGVLIKPGDSYFGLPRSQRDPGNGTEDSTYSPPPKAEAPRSAARSAPLAAVAPTRPEPPTPRYDGGPAAIGRVAPRAPTFGQQGYDRPTAEPVSHNASPTRLGAVRSAPSAPPPQPRTDQPPAQAYQQQEKPDCAKFPAAIANARSNEEKHALARLFLTCLMVNGMDQEVAKQQVIAVLETSYR
jgi:hypothetical protein